MQRRTFLAIAACSIAGSAAPTAPAAIDELAEHDSTYHLVDSIDRANHVVVDRGPRGQWLLTFVDPRTTPEGDRDVVVETQYPEPGLHIGGDVSHETGFWVSRRDGPSLMITFSSLAAVRVFRHVDRGKEVVLETTHAA